MTPSQELLEGCLRNDRKSQQQLYSLCYGFMMGVCLRYTGSRDDALAVMNLGFLKMLMNIASYRSQIPFEVWARTILIRTAIDEFRKKRAYNSLFESQDDLPPQVELNSIDLNAADEKLEAEYIHECMGLLPPVSRQVFNMFAVDGFPHKEIAGILGISEGTSKWHVNFAREKLKEMILEILTKEAITVNEK